MTMMKTYSSLDQAELSFIRLCCLTIFYIPYGMIYCLLGLFVFPSEAGSLYPEERGLGLTIMLAVSGVAQLWSPLIGKLSDESRYGLGRRRPFIIAGSLVGCLGFCLMWHASIVKGTFTYLIGLLLNQLALTVVCCAQQGLLPDFIPEERQGAISGWVSICMLAGSVSGFAWILFHYSVAIQTVYPLFSAMILVSMCITVAGANEVPGTMPLRRELLRRNNTDDRQPRDVIPYLNLPALTFREIKACYTMNFVGTRSEDFNWVFVSRMFYHMAISIQTFMVYYLRDVIKVPEASDQYRQMAILALIGQLSGAVVAYPMGKLSDRTGRKPLIYIACVVLTISYAGIGYSSSLSNPFHALYACSVIYGLGNGCFLAVDTALALDVLPDPAEAGKAFGIWGISGFIGLTLGPTCWALCLEFGGRTENGHYNSSGYYAFLSGGALVVFLSSLAVKQVKTHPCRQMEVQRLID